MLKVKMFGELSIENEHYVYGSSSSKSIQMTNLITYLIANKDTEITTDKLIEVLWPEDEEINNPQGALRNLIYRARHELNKFFPDEKKDCILFSRNSYAWNRALECSTDIECFEQCHSMSQKEPDEHRQYYLYSEMFNVYQGNFLPAQLRDEWVMFRSIYYQNIYIKTVLSMCVYLKTYSRYTEIIEICEKANQYDLMNESIYEETLRAYLSLGNPHKALEYYNYVVNLFVNKYGIDIAQALEDIYVEIVRSIRGAQISIQDLEHNLKERDEDKNSFFCNFDIFKNIYQINLRSAKRTKNIRYLALMTLIDEDAEGVMTAEVNEEMQILREIVTHYLRRNDVFTQSSYSQYSLIITVTSDVGKDIVISRIQERYNSEKLSGHIYLDLAIKLIA